LLATQNGPLSLAFDARVPHVPRPTAQSRRRTSCRSLKPTAERPVIRFEEDQWAVILGGSSGFGLAAAKSLSRHGMSVCVVHRDRRGAMERIEPHFDEIREHGHGFLALNLDALSERGRDEALDALEERLAKGGRIRVLLHSIAYGNLKGIVPPAGDAADGPPAIDEEDLARTIHAMGSSLLAWVQTLFSRGLFASDARVLGLTSEGNQVVWRGYAAVSAAKAALEAISRAIAVEFAPYGIRCNILQPGVTDTPALRAIPGNEAMRATAEKRNPLGRLTRPEDVAGLVVLMSSDQAAWVNGAIIPVDGGERIAPA
jgi:NAD(P)-dependent dehydrogenase (short-subunit alcohol dehydrogenase family)